MRLIPAPGSIDMQAALKSQVVHDIVDILLEVKRDNFFKLVASFIREFDRGDLPFFKQKLKTLKMSQATKTNNFIIPPHVNDLTLLLEDLYKQDEKKINYQRGAIVELLAENLINDHCNFYEYFGNYRVEYGYSDVSEQIDAWVWSEQRKEIEAYLCKVSYRGIKSIECTNFARLEKEVQTINYNLHLGAVCFANSRQILQRIEELFETNPSPPSIKAYGLDNFLDLEKSPF